MAYPQPYKQIEAEICGNFNYYRRLQHCISDLNRLEPEITQLPDSIKLMSYFNSHVIPALRSGNPATARAEVSMFTQMFVQAKYKRSIPLGNIRPKL